MRVLLVGAGAVGQVYGYFFQKGGAKIAFLVKPSHLSWARDGFKLSNLSKKREHNLAGYGLFTDPAEAMRETWDVVILCVPTDALQKGPWLDDVLSGLGTATLVTLQPGIDVTEKISARAPAGSVVAGLIGIVAYAAPLPGESLPACTAYWLPPFMRSFFSGAGESGATRARQVYAILKRGGMPIGLRKSVGLATAVGSALVGALVLAIEAAGWNFARFRSDEALLQLAQRSAFEYASVAAKHHGVVVPVAARLFRPGILRVITRVAPMVMPFDLEVYLREHFTKVGAQMHEGLAEAIATGWRQGQKVTALEDLGTRLGLPQRGAA